MKQTLILPLLLALFWLPPLSAQSGFLENYHATDPVPKDRSLSFEDKLVLHQSFLAEAKKNRDSLYQLYGFLYLSYDYYLINDYVNALPDLLEAEQLATASGNATWLAAVHFRRGSLYAEVEDDLEAIHHYQKSLSYSRIAKDSQHMAFNLEQIGALYSYLDQDDSAHYYYEQAFPLIEKFANKRSLAITLSNYGNVLNHEKRWSEAIETYDRALAVSTALNDPDLEVLSYLNLADAFIQTQQLDTALQIYQQILPIIKENDWLSYLKDAYRGMSSIYEKTTQGEKALLYYKEYQIIEDSIIGVEVQKEILELEYQNEAQKVELEMARKEHKFERICMVLVTLLFLAGLGIFHQYRRKRQARQKLIKHQANLNQLTQTLVKKNTLLRTMEEQIAEFANADPFADQAANSEERFLYNQNILTDADWTSFKDSFEKTLPGFILHLRESKPDFSEAEERLFLLLKLKLTHNEIAAFLGLSPDRVERTRIRLRKRLELDQEDSLEDYIRVF